MPAGAGDRDRRRADRRWLVDHHRQRPVGGELAQQRPRCGFAVGQWPVVRPVAGRVQAHGVVFALADIQAEKYPETPGYLRRGGRR
ncbi:hypothetical protein SAMN05216174_1223 [Actinokineospora iranica]|uniref:Uncharacterized protein n=1 Tax=Actinokineospora iranica TaxID=1271860 RepID=A0A1G6YJ13_9PSEU|nr:hypothetical protein SAMN05216174_1223 [Actinokineospora iranica]